MGKYDHWRSVVEDPPRHACACLVWVGEHRVAYYTKRGGFSVDYGDISQRERPAWWCPVLPEPPEPSA